MVEETLMEEESKKLVAIPFEEVMNHGLSYTEQHKEKNEKPTDVKEEFDKEKPL